MMSWWFVALVFVVGQAMMLYAARDFSKRMQRNRRDRKGDKSCRDFLQRRDCK